MKTTEALLWYSYWRGKRGRQSNGEDGNGGNLDEQ